MTISGRYFLVGCPRSGTTLLQSLLASHPKIQSFPESHFFWSLLEKRNKWHKLFRLSSSETNSRFKLFLNELEREDLNQMISEKSIFEWQHTNDFISILDLLTKENNKSIWLEKTPRHLHYIEEIQRLIPGSKFIHIIREGRDVVASLYDVTHKYPDIWGGPRDIDTCIQRWLNDFRITQNYQKKEHHHILRYEDLISNLQSTLTKICHFLDIDFDILMTQKYRKTAEKVSLENEPWKNSNRSVIQNSKSLKFIELFNEDERNYIDSRILSATRSK